MFDRIWAPWRSEYIMDTCKEEGCIFCNRIARNNDREDFILYRNEKGLIIMNIYPYSNGHLMIAPLKHISDIALLSDDENLSLISLIKLSQAALLWAMKPDGFNIGLNIGKAAGAGVEEHVHWHIVPRWFGDSNFMHSVSNCRIIPQSLEETYLLIQNELMKIISEKNAR